MANGLRHKRKLKGFQNKFAETTKTIEKSQHIALYKRIEACISYFPSIISRLDRSFSWIIMVRGWRCIKMWNLQDRMILRGKSRIIIIKSTLPGVLHLFFRPLYPCPSACSDTSLVTRLLRHCRYHRPRSEVLHFAENSLRDLSSQKSSDQLSRTDFKQSTSSCEAEWSFGDYIFICSFSSRSHSTGTRTTIERAWETTRVSLGLDWLDCQSKWIVIIPNKELQLFSQLETKVAGTKRNAFCIVRLVTY